MLPNGWLDVLTADTFSQISTGTKKVKTKDCKSVGKFPVIDQGQADIAGFVDDESKVINVVKPLVIFGDHTRAIKWIIKDFVPGADGTKVIEAANFLEPKYFYYQLRSLELPDKGYARHFRYLNETLFKVAPLAEQQQIAAKLDELLAQVDNLKTRLDNIPKILKRFRQSVLSAAVSGKLTEDWRVGNPQSSRHATKDHFENAFVGVEDKEKYFNSPIHWTWVRLSSQVKLINGDRGKNYPNIAEYVPIGLPFINTGHIEPNGTLSNDRMNYITRAKFDSLGGGKIQANDLVYCLRGATMGKAAIVNPLMEGAIASSLVIVRPKESITTSFTYTFLISPQGKDLILRYDNGSAQPNLSAKSLGQYPLALPPIEEQTEIVARVEELFAYADQIEQRVKDAQSRVNHLTQSILAKAFRGELTAEWRAQNPEHISGENSAEALLARIQEERETVVVTKKTVKKEKA